MLEIILVINFWITDDFYLFPSQDQMHDLQKRSGEKWSLTVFAKMNSC